MVFTRDSLIMSVNTALHGGGGGGQLQNLVGVITFLFRGCDPSNLV